jgi:broad specificity phosphatase PhoE
MVSKLGALKTYYQRNWEETLPSIFPNISQGHWKTVTHVAGLALPFVGLLYKPAGLAISYTSSSLNLLSTGAEAYQAENRTRMHAWSVLKNGAEFVGTVVSLRIGLVVHSVMNLGDNLYALRGIHDMTWSQTGEKMLPVASNALYLLTLVSFSTPVSLGILGASLVFQAGWSLYKANAACKEAKTWTDMKMLDTAAYTAMTLIYAAKAKPVLEQSYKIYTAVPRTFVLSRPASKRSKTDPNGALSEKGKILAEKMATALDRTAQDNNKTSLAIFTSPAAHHVETANLIVDVEDNFWDDEDDYNNDYSLHGSMVTVIQELHAKKKPEISMKNQVEGTTQPHEKTRLLPLKERWAILEKRWIESGQAAQGVESPAQVAARIDGAVRQILDQTTEESVLPVIVTDGTNITYYVESEILKSPNIPEKAARNLQDGGMRVVTMTPDEMGDLYVTEVIAVDPKKFEILT